MNNKWNRLDNVAKIFPSVAKGTDSQVFRLSCELFEDIEPTLLQKALDETLKIFSLYKYVLRRGLFWYYLESRDGEVKVREEHKPPCAQIYSHNKRTFLFDVTYYRNRVNLEIFHVLSDGTGAAQFLKMLITKYLAFAHDCDEPSIDYDASHSQMENDSFSKYYNDTAYKKSPKMPEAYRITGFRNREDRLSVIIGTTDVSELKRICREKDATITEYLCAVLVNSIIETSPIRLRKKPVVLAIPVNLRRYFPSESARNFFVLMYTSYLYSKDDSIGTIAEKVRKDFSAQLTEENLTELMNANTAAEHNLFARIVPLVLKDAVLKVIYRSSLKRRTAALSNLGAITMPPEMCRYVRSFDIYSGTDSIQLCICSFENKLSLSFTSAFESTDIQKNFFRQLTKEGLPMVISSNFEE